MRTKIVAGNWKMNNDLAETQTLIEQLIQQGDFSNKRVMIAPTAVHLSAAKSALSTSKIEVVAQNMHQAEAGAYTGEISGKMLKGIDVNTVILGHSERRAYFGETDTILEEKVAAALKQDIEVIFCFGEELEDRKAGNHFEVVASQIKNALFALDAAALKNIILAYEPVWAIGTGETASPEQAQEMHAFIRSLLAKKYGEATAQATSILYGGSVKPNNAQEIFSKADVDGGLIGGASLKAEDFFAIVKSL